MGEDMTLCFQKCMCTLSYIYVCACMHTYVCACVCFFLKGNETINKDERKEINMDAQGDVIHFNASAYVCARVCVLIMNGN